MRIKKDYANRRMQPVHTVSSEPADAAKMGAGNGAPRSSSETMIHQETAARARAARQFIPNVKLRK